LRFGESKIENRTLQLVIVFRGWLTILPPHMSGLRDIKSYSRRLQDTDRAERYARRFDSGARRRIDRREQGAVKKIFGNLNGCRSVLDVPSGAGRFVRTLAEGGRSVMEMDVAFEILEFARQQADDAGASCLVLQGDASRLPLADNAIDCVFSNRLLHHIIAPAERIAILREFHRVCRRWTVVSFFNYRGMARLRGFLKRLKGRQPPYEHQPTLKKFSEESVAAGFQVKQVISLGAPWVSQKYLLLEKTAS